MGLKEVYKLGKKKLPSVNIGNVVLVHEDNIKRVMWTTAALESLIVGKDGEFRDATLR